MSSQKHSQDYSWALFLSLITTVLAVGFFVSTRHLYKAGDNVGYNLGLAGGVMMLVLLLYPLRKRIAFLNNFGVLPSWFKWHMVLGILGPTAIVFHSTYHIGSINAGVAMICMLLVSGSGTFGRFFYTKIHHGLYGHQANVKEIEANLERSADIKVVLAFAPDIQRKLDEFHKQADAGADKKGLGFGRFISVGIKAALLSRSLSNELGQVVKQRMQGADVDAKLAEYNKMLTSYIKAIRDAAQFQTYERLFSLWHIFHIPLVYMMVFSAIYHVYAVHAY